MTFNKFRDTKIKGYLEVINDASNNSYIKTDGYISTKTDLKIFGDIYDSSSNSLVVNKSTLKDLQDGIYSTKAYVDSEIANLTDPSGNISLFNANLTGYTTIDNLEITYDVSLNFSGTYKSLKTELTNLSNNFSNYTTTTDLSNNYLKITDASNNYLKITDASNNYLKITDASNNYLRQSNPNVSGNLRVYQIDSNHSSDEIFLNDTIRINGQVFFRDVSNNYMRLDTKIQNMDASINTINTNYNTLNSLLYTSTSENKLVTISSGLSFTTGNERTMTTFTGLLNSKLYQIAGYVSVQISGTISSLKIYTRIEDGGGGGYTYHKIYSKNGADDGEEIFIQYNDNIRSSNTGGIVVKMCCIFAGGGTISSTGGILYPLLIQNY